MDCGALEYPPMASYLKKLCSERAAHFNSRTFAGRKGRISSHPKSVKTDINIGFSVLRETPISGNTHHK